MSPISALHLAAPPGLRPELADRLGQAGGLRDLKETELAGGAAAVSGQSFSDLFTGLAREVSAKQAAAGEAAREVLAGGAVNLHQAMIAMEEANVSFQLMVEVRNKLLESYQELMRMQV